MTDEERQAQALAMLENLSDQVAQRVAGRLFPSQQVDEQATAWAAWQAQQAQAQAAWAEWQAQQAQAQAQDPSALVVALLASKKANATPWPGNSPVDVTIAAGAGVDTGSVALSAPETGTISTRRRFGVTLTPAGTPAVGVQAVLTFPAAMQLALSGREPPVIRVEPLTRSGQVVAVPVVDAVLGKLTGISLEAVVALTAASHKYLVTLEG